MSDNPFDGLEDAFDAPHAHELEDFDGDKVPVVVKRDTKLCATEEAHESYLIENMINSIETARYAVERMENEIKQGTDARTYEVYGQLIDTLNRQVSEFNKYLERKAKLKLEYRKLRQKTKQLTIGDVGKNDKIQMSAAQLTQMMRAAQDSSEMKKVTVDFKIESYGKETEDA